MPTPMAFQSPPADQAPATRTAKGARTRAALVAAARAVFERDGFLDSRLVDITREANVAVGTFYTHFESREQILAAVLEDVQEEMLHPRVVEANGKDDPIAGIESANRAYLLAYRRNARLMALLEEVAAVNESFMRLRRRRADAFIRRNARRIRELQASGAADRELDPVLTADALSSMVSRMAHRAFVQGRRVPFETLVQTTTRLWANALRLEKGAGR